MTIRVLRACFALALFCGIAAAQGRTILRAYAGNDARAHVVLRDGTEYVAPREGSAADGDEQQGVEQIQVAEDGRAAGWLVLFLDCCTSYPIPLELVVYRDGSLLPGLPLKAERAVFQWQFWKGSSQVALLYQAMHGAPDFQAQLFDVTSSKKLAEWSEPQRHTRRLVLPPWIEAFRRYMEQALQFER